MAGINFRTETKLTEVIGTSASTVSNPNNATLLFTCPLSYEAEVVFLMVANEDNSTSNIGIQVYHSDDNTFHFLHGQQAIPGLNHVQFIGSGPLFLHEGDKVLVFRYNASQNFDATISCRLYYTPARRL